MADLSKAYLGGGCFWCLEAEFRRVPAVTDVRCGYEGGKTENPTYEQVCSGRTGHAEAVEITYDPQILSYHDLLAHFLTRAHDPTQKNGQGVDLGTQYRSVIFYESEAQKKEAEAAIAAVNASGQWKKPVVTTLEPHGVFWPAENYHQDYYARYEQQRGQPHVRYLYKKKKWAEGK
jgi:peptide-methionine (S)-S-oxide reductase